MELRSGRILASVFAALGLAASSLAFIQPRSSPASDRAFRHPALFVPERNQPAASVTVLSPAERDAALAELGVGAAGAFFDPRTGRWSSLVLATPLLPGSGVGNRLSWIAGHPPGTDAEWRQAAASAVWEYVTTHPALRLDAKELGATPRAAVYGKGALAQVWIPRVVGGIPVRGNAITATLNHGNLVLLGLPSWGDIDAPLTPAISADEARARAEAFIAPLVVSRRVRAPRLELVPVDGVDTISYRLVWAVESRIAGDTGRWESLVDALDGEVLAFEDKNEYAQRTVVGGVYPLSNDGSGPEGIEQAGWPMPWADVSDGVTTRYTDGGGNAGCIPGSISTALSGLFVQIVDTCGAINESSGADALDLGTSGGTNCTVPGGHSAGDTHSARSGFYELNRIKEQARGQLPGNAWLQQSLIANMNINQNCNAFWNGATVNFFVQGGGCGNTGEIAAVFDHEWGHGMDNNGANPTISSPGESIADIYAALRLATSCIGRGFLLAGDCSGYGDACTDCSGIRDIDWAKHVSNAPHTLAFAQACPAVGTRGPCNRETHCEGMVAAEVAWDLANRDLTAAPFNMGSELARETATRLFYLGAAVITSWYECTPPNGGCPATGGYLNVLAADDDNGNLTDGTPHMTAIFAAFNRHQLACAAPAVANSGCVGGPTGAPTLTVETGSRSASLTWTAVANATAYAVYRTEGVAGCDFGKVKIAETADLAFIDEGLQNGRTYYYNVQALGATDACFGPMSVCQSGIPLPGPSLSVPAAPVVSGGDGDPFLDNCEVATATFDVLNDGGAPQTNVRIVAVEPLTHPSTILITPLPIVVAANLDACASAEAAIELQAQGLSFDETSDVRVTLASNELDALGATRQVTLRFSHVESDLSSGDVTFGFESDLEGWSVVSGTFTRTTVGGGANGTTAHVTSSEFLDNACDVIRSPLFRILPGATLTLFQRHNIEPTSDQVYDRANVSVFDLLTGQSTAVSPNTGNLYSGGTGQLGPCVTSEEPGWNGSSPGYPAFVTSGWNAASLSPGGVFDGRLVQLEIASATDFILVFDGLDFDQVTLTGIELQVPDAQTDVCIAGGGVVPLALEVDGDGNGVLEAGETAAISPTWRNPGAAPVDLTASASNFTGPAGPTYTLTDGAAAYGTIPVSGASVCTDCYAVSIDAAARPATHWDATILETVSEPVPAKTWTLHVGDSFTDVLPSTNFYPFVENVFHNGVTAGCGGGTTYCPTQTVTRQQMAVFLLKSKEGAGYTPPACSVPAFPDVPCSNPFSPWINELVARGVTAGCGGGNYCPANPTTREQMAVFLLKTKEGSSFDPPACVTPQFDDVPCSSGFSKWINELVARGITAGCGGTLYCPTNPVLRQQMAVFLVRTFGLQLYGP